MKVVIVLATYNGARYVGEQISSIGGQTFTDWTLLIRDDGSTDGTNQLLEAASADDGRITVLSDGRGNLGPIGNFGALLDAARELDADYVFLSDQDDIWLPHKLSDELACLSAAEKAHGVDTPLVVHSDLTVVDPSGSTISSSFMSYEHFRHDDKQPIKTLLAQNFVTGCTVAVNRTLLELALPIPREVVMHDWWLALCAATWGRLAFLPRSTVLYRQHGRNQVGSKGYWKRVRAKLVRLLLAKNDDKQRKDLERSTEQARALLKRVQENVGKGHVVDERIHVCIRDYAEVLTRRWADRLRLVLMHHIRPQSMLRTLHFYQKLVYWKRPASWRS